MRFVTEPACQDLNPPKPAAARLQLVRGWTATATATCARACRRSARTSPQLNHAAGSAGPAWRPRQWRRRRRRLTWTAAHDPDLGDSIAFYRVYRDGNAYEDRYDRTGDGATLSLVDGRSDGTTHTYWVSAVDAAGRIGAAWSGDA